MVTLIIVGVCLWLYGMYRTLTVYVAIIVSVVAFILTAFAGVGFSYLFFNESVRAFDGGGYWSSAFVERDGFHLAEAPLVPVIFFFDLIKKGFQFCWQVPNPFSIGFFGFWWWLMFVVWGGVVLPTLFPNSCARITPIR